MKAVPKERLIPTERQKALNNLAKLGTLLRILDANTLLDIETFFRTTPTFDENGQRNGVVLASTIIPPNKFLPLPDYDPRKLPP